MIYPEINCPECNTEVIDTVTEENYVLFCCRDCDWRKIETKPFFIDGWYIQVRQALAPIDILQSLLTDGDVVNFLRPRLKGVSHVSQPIPNFSLSDDYYRGEIEIAHKVYLSQMVVVAVTYAELIIESFYYALFSAQPKRINSYLATDGRGKAIIDLNEVIDARSKEDLVERLIKRAASKASKGGLDEIVGKIIKESKTPHLDSFIADLESLESHRNKIVHEAMLDEVKVEQVIGYFGLVLYMLYILAEASIFYRIVVVDDSNLIYDFRDRTQKKRSSPPSI